MLSHEDNRLLAQTGPNTPMGELFRRFWLPAALAAEVVNDGPPLRLRILSEDLVAFRDSQGRVGIVQAYCSHKLAPLFFGRNEDCGLRCVYHGWKFDVAGNCVDVPNVPDVKDADSLKRKVGLKAYATREAGGVIWVYMGPSERMPQLPEFEWILAPRGHTHVSRWLQRSNWAQGMEGEIDSSHISFLHRQMVRDDETSPFAPVVLPGADGSPVMTLEETPYGYRYGARRHHVSGDFYWRITHWLVPMYSLIATQEFPRGGRAWVPVDDNHVMAFGYNYRADRPFIAEEIAYIENGSAFPPRLHRAAHQLPDGYVIDTYLPLANKGNDYLIDRAMQKRVNYTGIYGINEQDRALQENMPGSAAAPGAVDRTREHLVYSDVPAITARRILLKLARDLAAGSEPYAAGHGEIYRVRALGALSPAAELNQFLDAFARESRVIY